MINFDFDLYVKREWQHTVAWEIQTACLKLHNFQNHNLNFKVFFYKWYTKRIYYLFAELTIFNTKQASQHRLVKTNPVC